MVEELNDAKRKQKEIEKMKTILEEKEKENQELEKRIAELERKKKRSWI